MYILWYMKKQTLYPKRGNDEVIFEFNKSLLIIFVFILLLCFVIMIKDTNYINFLLAI